MWPKCSRPYPKCFCCLNINHRRKSSPRIWCVSSAFSTSAIHPKVTPSWFMSAGFHSVRGTAGTNGRFGVCVTMWQTAVILCQHSLPLCAWDCSPERVLCLSNILLLLPWSDMCLQLDNVTHSCVIISDDNIKIYSFCPLFSKCYSD